MKFGKFEIGSDALFVMLILIILVFLNCETVSKGVGLIITAFK